MENGTKKCACCGKELPVEMFCKCAANADGLYSYCKACAREKARASYKGRVKSKAQTIVHSINVELQRFTPRELIAELRSRGYVGELKYTQVIKV